MSSDPHNPLPEPADAAPASGKPPAQTAPAGEPVVCEPAAPGEQASEKESPAAGGILPVGVSVQAGSAVPQAGAEPASCPAPAVSQESLAEKASPAQSSETTPEGAMPPEAPGPAAAEPAQAPSPASAAPARPKSDRMDWYILKVQSNREESIREGLRRRIAIAGYEHYFGDIIIPMEKVTEVKAGKKRTYKRKLYPGYLMVQMEINEDTWFLVRETPGIGDFTGAGGHPTPMNPREVQAILAKQEEKPDQQEKVKINFRIGDRVKIKEGTFESFEGEVSSIDETNGRVTVLINIFGRSTPVDIEYWQIEAV